MFLAHHFNIGLLGHGLIRISPRGHVWLYPLICLCSTVEKLSFKKPLSMHCFFLFKYLKEFQMVCLGSFIFSCTQGYKAWQTEPKEGEGSVHLQWHVCTHTASQYALRGSVCFCFICRLPDSHIIILKVFVMFDLFTRRINK